MNVIKNISFTKVIFFALQLIALNGVAQAPSLINYQGAARRSDGTPIINKTISIKFDLHQGTNTGSVVATESQTIQTNEFGLFTTQIGKNTNLSLVNWQGGAIFLEVSVDTTAGTNFTSLGTQQMVSSPYAIHAGSVPTSYTNNVLTIGNSTYNISPTVTAVPNTSVTLSGVGTVTSAGTNTFDINIPAPTFTNTGQQIITGTYPNFTVSTPTVPASAVPTIAITNTAGATSTVVSSGNSFSINVPPPTFSNTGQPIITGTYPNYIVNTPTVGATPNTTINPGGIVQVTNPATNSFVVSAPSPTFTSAGPVTITGAYPNLTVNSTAAANATVSQGATGIISVSNPATNSFVVSASSPTFTSSGPVTVGGTYPNLTITSPTVPPTTTVSPSGFVTVSNPVTNSFVVGVPQPTFTSSGPVTITGAYPNLTVNSTAASNATVSQGATGIISVSNPATNSFVVSAPTPTFTNTGQTIITGSYPNFSVNTPTYAANNATVSPSGFVTVSNPATNSFVVGVPQPTFTSSGPVTITGTYPNLTVTSPAAITPTVTGTGLASVTPTTGSSFVVDVPALTYTSSTGALGSGTNSVSILQPLTLSGTTITSGPASNSINLSALSPWTSTGGTVSLATSSNYVGIGTNSPTSNLEVRDNTSYPIIMLSTTNSALNTSPHVALATGVYSNGGGTATRTDATWQMGLRQSATGVTSSSDRWYVGRANVSSQDLVVSRDGNVGVGTTSPAEALQVERSSGSAGVSILAASGQISDLSFGVSGGTHFMGNIRYDNSTNSMNFWTNNTTNRLVIDNNGSVGIGTVSPSGNFHLKSSGTQVLHRISSTGAPTGLVTYADNLSSALLNYENTPLYFGTNGANRMVISNTGAVGINIVAPTATLHVVGTTRLVDGNQGLGKVLTSDASGNATWQAASSDWGLGGNLATSASTSYIGTGDNIPLRFRVNNVASGTIDQLAFNAFFGYQSGSAITTGSLNAGIGHTALAANTTGIMNAAVGYRALNANNTGNGNAAIGTDALLLNTSGIFNVAAGLNASRGNTTGGQNVALGKDALYNNSIGSNNVGIGYQAGFSSVGSNNVFLGNNAGYSETTSNKLYIANSSGTPLIYGDFATPRVGINTAAPGAMLTVNAASLSTGFGLHLNNARDVIGAAFPFVIDMTTNGQTYGTNTYGRMIRLNKLATSQGYDMGIDANDAFFLANVNNYSPVALSVNTSNYVGIGTSTAHAPLQFGNIIANRKIVLWETANDDHQYYGLGINNSTLRYQVDGPGANHVWYAGLTSTTSDELLRVQGNGRVGINQAAPTATLDVNGTTKLVDGTQGLDKVLRSDASGNASWVNSSINTGFSAYANTGQSISSTSFTPVNFGGEDFDDGNDFASNTYVCPSAGVYQFDASVSWSPMSSASGWVHIALYINGSIAKYHMVPCSTGYFSISVNGTFKCANAATVQVYVYHQQSGSESIYGVPQYTYFTGHRVY